MALFGIRARIERLERRGETAELIALLDEREMVAARRGGMVDWAAARRGVVVDALGRMTEDEMAALALADALEDPDTGVRQRAIRGLVSHGGRRELEAVARALGRWEPPAHRAAREVAFAALVRAAHPRVPGWFVESLLTERGAAPVANDELILDRLLEVADQDVGAVTEAVGRVAHLADPERVGKVCSWLGSDAIDLLLAGLDEPATRAMAARSLGHLHDSRAVEPLIGSLDSDDPCIRLEVVRALGRIKDPAALGALLRASQDPTYDVRVAALEALDGFGSIAVAASVVAASGSVESAAQRLLAAIPGQERQGDRPLEPPAIGLRTNQEAEPAVAIREPEPSPEPRPLRTADRPVPARRSSNDLGPLLHRFRNAMRELRGTSGA